MMKWCCRHKALSLDILLQLTWRTCRGYCPRVPSPSVIYYKMVLRGVTDGERVLVDVAPFAVVIGFGAENFL